jgi:modulator of FtsH protease HflC
MKKNPLNMTIGALLIVIFGLLLFLFQVRTSEVVVVTTFGKPAESITAPGLYAKWPWPIQKVHKLDKRIQNFESEFNETYTSDGVTLLVNVYGGWRITDPAMFFPQFRGGSVDAAQGRIAEIVRDAKNAVVGKHAFSDFISTDEKKLKFAQIETEILALVRQRLAGGKYGLAVEFIGIKKLGLPESVTQNVFERMQSERQVLVSRIESEGSSQAEMIRATANRDAAKLVSEADAEATRIRGEGEAEAAKSFAVLNQDPTLANFLQRLTGLEMFLRDRTTLILDQNTSPLDLLNRPASSTPPRASERTIGGQ